MKSKKKPSPTAARDARHFKRRYLWLLVAPVLLALGVCTALNFRPPDQQDPSGPTLSPAGLPLGTVTIGEHRFDVEIAETPAARARGLMHRESLAPDSGMLFVYDQPHFLAFWMRDTLIPLDVAFIDGNLAIINLETMAPLTLDQHASAGAALYALELNAGEFERRGIQPGDVVYIERKP